MVPKMPDEYKGNLIKNCGYTTTIPRSWSEEEVKWLKYMIAHGCSTKEIAESMGRSCVSVSIKRKRLSKKSGGYNTKHIEEKYAINRNFLEQLKPGTILDVYAGNCFYKNEGYNSVTNDISDEYNTDSHEDALKFLCGVYRSGKKFDLVDLDPFGSAYECFDLAIKIAKKGIIITLGELGHKRWKRLDFVRTHYDITSIEDFTIDSLVSYIQKIGFRNKKKLIVQYKKEWNNIGRVWFSIEPVKIVEQWEKNNG